LAKTYRALGDRADYLLVKNPARFRSPAFDESALAELFRKNKVPVLEYRPLPQPLSKPSKSPARKRRSI